MTVLLVIWVGVGTALTIGARRVFRSPWPYALRGFTWPTWGLLIGISRLRYAHRRRSLP